MIIEEIKNKIKPSVYQEAIYQAILHTNKNIVVKASAGCLSPDTLILMYNGQLKKAKDIQIGDLLMGPDSTSRTVLKTNKGVDQMFKIIPQKGSSWICNSHHVLTVHDEHIATSIKKYKNTKHKTPLIDIPISILLQTRKMVLSKGVYGDFISRYRLQRVGVNFTSKKTNIPPYLMGLWLGDGTLAGPYITSKDQEIIDYCKNLKLPNITCKVVPDNNCFTIRFTGINHSKKVNFLREEFKNAVIDNQKYIPRNYLINSYDNRVALLAGLIDSDGYLGKNIYEICSKYESLKDDIIYLCRSLGLAAYATYQKRTIKSLNFEGWYWIISISGELSSIPVLLKRKRAQKRKQIKSVLRTGFKIESLGEGNWCGFQVDKDNRFLLGDFTITHNSGKTTTIVEASKLIPHNKCSLFAAFNKSIVEELSSRLPSHVVCSTIHSIGMRALMSHFKTTFRINEYKIFPIAEEVMKLKPESEKREAKQLMPYLFSLRDAIDLARMTMVEWEEESIFNLCTYYSIELLEHEIKDVISILKRLDIYNRSFTKKYNYIDYVDMIHLPVTNHKIKLPKFDFLFIDESQDLNRSQHYFIERLLAPGGRTIAVGDPRQSLYSFIGADLSSFERFEKRPNTISLPLSISYRCGTNIVELARAIYPDIEPNPTNEPGEIRYGALNEVRDGDMIICRNNRPLIHAYFEILEKHPNVSPIIIGKDIQNGLEALVGKVIKYDTEEGIELLWQRLIVLMEELKQRKIKKVHDHPQYVALLDKIKTIEIIAQRFHTMKEVKQEIANMFAEKEKCVKLQTIHKSKGDEADRVFIIERFDGQKLLPSPYAMFDWEKVQETNLQFVAITRAKKSLIFIHNINSK